MKDIKQIYTSHQSLVGTVTPSVIRTVPFSLGGYAPSGKWYSPYNFGCYSSNQRLALACIFVYFFLSLSFFFFLISDSIYSQLFFSSSFCFLFFFILLLWNTKLVMRVIFCIFLTNIQKLLLSLYMYTIFFLAIVNYLNVNRFIPNTWQGDMGSINCHWHCHWRTHPLHA